VHVRACVRVRLGTNRLPGLRFLKDVSVADWSKR
jgi:hypothetical protein